MIISSHQPSIFIPLNEQLENKHLPEDIIKNIFNYVKSFNFFCDLGVSHQWYVQNLEMAKNSVYFSLKSFLESLVHQLEEPYLTQIKNELLLNNLNKVLDSNDFMQLQASLFTCREAILNILKNLDNEKLKKLKFFLKNESKPLFFDELFDLVELYKDIDTLLGEGEGNNLLGFSWIIESLKEKRTFNKINKLLDVTQFVSDELKLHAFKTIATELKIQGLRDKAIGIASTIKASIQREEAIKLIMAE